MLITNTDPINKPVLIKPMAAPVRGARLLFVEVGAAALADFVDLVDPSMLESPENTALFPEEFVHFEL